MGTATTPTSFTTTILCGSPTRVCNLITNQRTLSNGTSKSRTTKITTSGFRHAPIPNSGIGSKRCTQTTPKWVRVGCSSATGRGLFTSPLSATRRTKLRRLPPSRRLSAWTLEKRVSSRCVTATTLVLRFVPRLWADDGRAVRRLRKTHFTAKRRLQKRDSERIAESYGDTLWDRIDDVFHRVTREVVEYAESAENLVWCWET